MRVGGGTHTGLVYRPTFVDQNVERQTNTRIMATQLDFQLVFLPMRGSNNLHPRVTNGRSNWRKKLHLAGVDLPARFRHCARDVLRRDGNPVLLSLSG